MTHFIFYIKEYQIFGFPFTQKLGFHYYSVIINPTSFIIKIIREKILIV